MDISIITPEQIVNFISDLIFRPVHSIFALLGWNYLCVTANIFRKIPININTVLSVCLLSAAVKWLL